MTASHARSTLDPDEQGYVMRFFKDFIARVFKRTKSRPEDELIFRGYYYRILIRHLRITFALLAVFYAASGFFLNFSNPGLFASHLVFAMIAIVTLGASFLSFFRLIWKIYIPVFATAAFIIAYLSVHLIPTTVEVSMICLIAVCLMSGLPFMLTLLLVLVNMILYEVIMIHNHANKLSMLLTNAFFAFFVLFLMYAARARILGIRTQFDTLETVKVQRRKSDSIIQHMLPPFVVQKLKAKHDSVIVDHFDSVTVMFCEIVNFNALLEKMPAQEVVQLLNDIYTAFDRLTDVHGVNKVEHIGNVYVVSAGCPEVTPYHSGRVAEMGLKMLSVVRHFKKVELRLGIHTGAVMAGVIGFKKLSYHLFGDTINTASRMCSHGAIQRIHVSESTYQLLSTKYIFESRGEIGVKGKGVMSTYFLDGRKMNTQAYAHAHVSNFAAERSSFTMQAQAAIPAQPASDRFFHAGGSYQLGPVGALASEFSHNIGQRTHRAGYVAARPSTASNSSQPLKRTPWTKRILSCMGTPDYTPIQSLEDEEEIAKGRYKKNALTLRFVGEPGVEEAFRDRNADVHHTRMCCSMLFSLVGFGFCGIYDYYWAQGPRAPYYVLRYLFCGIGLICIGVAMKFRQYVEVITLMVLSSTLFVTLVIEVWAHEHQDISLTTVVLTMFIASMTFNVSCVRFMFSTIIHLIGFLLFEFLQLIQPTGTYDMGVHSAFVVFGMVMNMVACYMQERYERDNWVQELVLDDEIDKTDALLTGLLPVSVLVELKEGRQLIADEFEQVSVMLTDIVGFTEIASRITPAQLVEMLNILFSVFDRLAEKYGVLKIATIGDAYLCIAGCPEKTADHADKIANMALEMIESVKSIFAPDGTQVRVRIGMHTGPVIAGVVGIKMIHYQIWGDTVQIAQKMESSGKASHIHVSKDAHALLEKNFVFEPADMVKVKNHDMATYFLSARKHPKSPIIAAVKRGFASVGPNTPRIIDLSSSMIFQNAGSWKMKKPSSPPATNLTSSQRMLSAKRFPRTPRRGDMLTPLPTNRARKMSMLVPAASRNDAIELGEPENPPSFILDNILGMNIFHESSELSPLDPSEDFNYDDDVISGDEMSTLGSSPSTLTRGDDDDEIIAPISNFSFSNGLRLSSLVVPAQQTPPRLPPSPSGPNLARSQPNFASHMPHAPFMRDLRASARASEVPSTRSRSDSPTRASESPTTRPRSDSLHAHDIPSRPRSDSLTVPDPSSSRLSRSGELPRVRSNSSTRGNPISSPSSPTSLSHPQASSSSSSSSSSTYLYPHALSPPSSPTMATPFTHDLLAHTQTDPARADASPNRPHLILQISAPPSVPFVPKSPLSKDSLRIPLHEPDLKPTNSMTCPDDVV